MIIVNSERNIIWLEPQCSAFEAGFYCMCVSGLGEKDIVSMSYCVIYKV